MAIYGLKKLQDDLGGVYWVLYEAGFFSEPKLILSDQEMEDLFLAYEEQKPV